MPHPVREVFVRVNDHGLKPVIFSGRKDKKKW